MNRLACLGLLLALLPAQSSAQERLTAQELLVRGKQKVTKRDYAGAIQDLSAAIQAEPKLAGAYYYRGVALLSRRKSQKALADFSQVIALQDPLLLADAYAQRGATRVRLSDRKGALVDYGASLRLRPDPDVYWKRATIRAQLKDSTGAEADYAASLRLRPTAYRYFMRGSWRYWSKNYSGAVEDFTQAIRLAPKTIMYHQRRGGAYKRLARYAEAMADFKLVLKLDPVNPSARLNLGECKHGMGELDAAIRDFDAVINKNPRYPRAYACRAAAKRALGQLKGSVADWRRAVTLNPHNVWYRLFLGRVLRLTGDCAGAVESFDHVIEKRPKLARGYFYRGLANADQRKFREAIHDYTKTLALSPNHPKALSHRGRARALAGDRKKAVADLSEAQKRSSNADLAIWRYAVEGDDRVLQPLLRSDSWNSQRARFLLGKLSAEALLETAREWGMEHEGRLMVGLLADRRKDRKLAMRHYAACADSSPVGSIERRWAQARIAQLKRATKKSQPKKWF